MAEVFAILGAIETSANILSLFAGSIKKYRQVSDKLFDIQEGLEAAELTLESWRRKYDVQDRRPVVYMHVLFGRLGWDVIRRTLGSIRIISKAINRDIDGVVARALRFKPHGIPQEQLDARYDERLVRECIRRIGRSTSWTRKFKYGVLGKAEDLQIELERLNRKLVVLERLSDGYLEREHPEIFQDIKRLPGRRVMLRVGDSRDDAIQRKLLDALAVRKDAELLHRASGQGNKINIGISVPQIHKRDFAFLLSLQGRTQEVLVKPIKFGEGTDRNLLEPNITSTIPALVSNALQSAYMLPPSAPLSAGFEVTVPPTNILADLEYRESLNSLFTKQQSLSQQSLYPQDQVAVACGIVQGCFRLLGSRWLQFVDSKNIRWRRSADGKWTSMMSAIPGDSSTTRTLDRVIDTGLGRRDHRDLSRHVQMFRIGLLLAELALKTPITYIEFDSQTSGAKIYIDELGREAKDAHDLAAQVETRTNILYGNMVYFCLAVLQDNDMMNNKEIESDFYRDVLIQSEELENLLKGDRRRGSPGVGSRSPT